MPDHLVIYSCTQPDRGTIKANKIPFTCPKCGYQDREFHQVCPECGRPFVRDYIDTRVHPGDPDPAGIYSGKFRARVRFFL